MQDELFITSTYSDIYIFSGLVFSASKGVRPTTPKTYDAKARVPSAKTATPKGSIPSAKPAQANNNEEGTEKQKIVQLENSYAADWEEVTELMEEVC